MFNVIKKVKLLVDVAKVSYQNGVEANFEPEWVADVFVYGRKIPVYQHDLILSCYGSIPAAMVAKTNDGYAIFINKPLTELPQRHKDAILYHEMGHVAKEHLDKHNGMIINLMRTVGHPTATSIELEADAFAVSHGYAKELLDVLKAYVERGATSKELKVRIKRLESECS